jgi:hypothetical protein
MNASKYQDVLQQHAQPYFTAIYPDGNFVFQQDNAPCHKAISIRHFLDSNGITTLTWPPYSPDLNCIENLWATLKRKLHEQFYTTRQQLITAATNIWETDDEIRQECIQLIEHMPQRLRECIASKGGYTHY